MAPKGLTIKVPIDLTGVKTIIVEDGDLVINKNITYSGSTSSWAFIVKKGNIKIAQNVTKIAGVFMVLNGKIMSDGNDIDLQLKVDGSFYGDPKDLIDHRTYVYGVK